MGDYRKARDMKRLIRAAFSIVMGVFIVLSCAPTPPSSYAAEATETTEATGTAEVTDNTIVKSQKTAKQLDQNNETQVTLSFPGKQDVLASDVVFVLDKSGASAQEDIFNQAKTFLGDIKQQSQEKGLNIKAGVVLFNRIGNIKQDLTDVATGYDDILNAMNSSVSMGTNMHAGLLAAKKMLDEDKEVLASNKHIILISDGATYLYCKDDDYTKAYTRSFGDPKKQTNPKTSQPYANGADRKGGIWEYQSREYNTPNNFKKFGDGKNFTLSEAMRDPNKLDEYLVYYREQEQNADKNWAQYEYEYNFGSAYFGSGRKTTPIDVNAPANIDIAFMKTDDTFQEMVNAGYNMNVYFKNAADFDGKVFLKYLARKSNKGELNSDFAKLKKTLLDCIASGSTVEDYIGKDFDFVNDPKKISLKVGEEKLELIKVNDNEYSFGKDKKGEPRFSLTYTSGDKEKLELKINETIYPHTPVSLTYREKLVNVPTQPGDYTFNTNESAVLRPVDGNGNKGADITFPVPSVSLGVKGPGSIVPHEVVPEYTGFYSDKPVVTIKKKSEEIQSPALPKTADQQVVAPYILMLAGFSLLGVALTIKNKKRA